MIDFVILWVDGNDEKWLKEKNKYSEKKETVNNSNVRYRDWDNLKYWFRAVEKYAPWVNNIFFITYGHLPDWINTECSKLKIVRHEDFIPKEFLPTFSSDVIELNLHRIKDLSENFVLFNDDFFLNSYVKPEFFFKDNKPVDLFIEDAVLPTTDFSKVFFNNEQIINKYFDKRTNQKKLFRKIYNIRYGRFLIRNILLAPWYKYSTFKNLHLPQPFKKSVFEKIWSLEGNLLRDKCIKKFRSDENISQYLVKDWQLVSGDFHPGFNNRGKLFNVQKDFSKIKKEIISGKSKMICINDSDELVDFEKAKKEINECFEQKLCKKSNFEK